MSADFQPLVDAIERSKQELLDARTRQIAEYLATRSLGPAAACVLELFLDKTIDQGRLLLDGDES